MDVLRCLHLCTVISFATSFIPHPAIRLGGQAGNSITHTDMAQMGFARSLARFFLDTQIPRESDAAINILNNEHTIDELFKLAHPDWSNEKIALYSYPLKSTIDKIQVRDALVDLNPETKNLPSAHFDSESFVESNRRIMDLRAKIVEDAMDPNKDLDKARGRLGELLHTLQDFYSHSNWVEMGKKDVNGYIGIQADIGPIARPDESTCTSNGCQKIRSECNFLQRLFLKTCPMEYYDCKDNILSEINEKGILTSGYVSGQSDANENPVVKPTNAEKCSHGSVMDKTSHQPPVGGINKDSMTPVFSPHYHLHFDAAKLAIQATERFFNDLRKDIGNVNFDRFFIINPNEQQISEAQSSINTRKQFHFFTSTLSVGLSTGDINFDRTLRQRIKKILEILFGIKDSNAPTYDLTDAGIAKDDINIHASSLLLDTSKSVRKRVIGRRRHHFSYRI